MPNSTTLRPSAQPRHPLSPLGNRTDEGYEKPCNHTWIGGKSAVEHGVCRMCFQEVASQQPQPIIYSVIHDGDGFRIHKSIPGQVGKTSKALYLDPLAAADYAYWLVSNEAVAMLSLPDHLKDQLIAHYQIEGQLCYQGKSTRYVEPWNEWMLEGFNAARAQAEGILVWGWPTSTPQPAASRAWSGAPTR